MPTPRIVPGWTSTPAESPAPDWWRAFRPEASFEQGHVLVQPVGDLVLPQGSLVVADLDERPAPLPLEITPGAYPVFLSVLHLPSGDERVAGALVQVAPKQPVRWERSYAFQVDTGSACLADQVCWRRYQRDWEEYLERIEHCWHQPGQTSWDWANLPIEAPSPPGLPQPNLLRFSTGLGDGLYATYLGYDVEGAPVAVVAGCGLLPGDSAEACPKPDRPDLPWLAALRGEFLRRYNLGLRDGDFGQLTELLAAEATLVLPSATVARGDVTAALRAAPFGPGRISANSVPGGADLETGTLTLRFTAEGKPRQELGTLRLETKQSLITRILVELDAPPVPGPPASVSPPEGPKATAQDQDLVESLVKLEGLRPLQRSFVDEVRRQVLGLNQPLSEAQRDKAQGLLD